MNLWKQAAVGYRYGTVQKMHVSQEKSESPLMDTYPHGIPLGGIGAGTIGRTPDGDFSVWHLATGRHNYEYLPACAFHYYEESYRSPRSAEYSMGRVLTASQPADGALSKWNFGLEAHEGEAQFLYPKAQYEYQLEDSRLELVCHQSSPIIPHNYRETSFPVAVFEWEIKNPGSLPVTASIAFSFENITGWDTSWPSAVHNSELCEFIKHPGGQINRIQENKNSFALVFENKHRKGQMAIATAQNPRYEISYQNYIDPNGPGSEFSNDFYKKGVLENRYLWKFPGQRAGAIAVRFEIKPGETLKIPFALSWDFPMHDFKKGKSFYRKYTSFFGKSGSNAFKIADQAIRNASKWLGQVETWQNEILKEKKFPAWLYGMAFNEMYFIADGGTVWTDRDQFGSVECFDYFFYETLDVRYYGSFPLIKFWPKLEKAVMKQFAKVVLAEDKTHTRYWKYHWLVDEPIVEEPVEFYSGAKKLKGSVPHDLGSLQDSPLVDYNGYIWRNCNYWKDLNAKFVLLVYRDYLNDEKKDKAFLKSTWPAVKSAIHYLQAMDKDGDGIPENSGFPDQTYDNWIMSGASSYCGSLWLACLQAGAQIAGLVGQKSEQRLYQKWFQKSKPSFVKKLWNGKYFDCYENCDDILSDQLNGQWYARMLQLPDLFTKKQITSSLKTIYEYNVSSFGNGFRGVVNGRKANGKHCGHEQGDDAWVGTSFAVAALMMQNGLKQEATQVLIGLYQTIYLEKGLFFRTPEGWREDGNFVGSMYMRAGAVWSLFF